MSVKLKGETSLTIDATDLAEILTEHFCSSSYDAFGELQVDMISHDQANRDFTLTFSPKPDPKPEEQN